LWELFEKGEGDIFESDAHPVRSKLKLKIKSRFKIDCLSPLGYYAMSPEK
jgi:hypothetical protein